MYLIRNGEICEVNDEARVAAMLKQNPELLETLIAEMIDLMGVMADRDQARANGKLREPSAAPDSLSEELLEPSLRWLLGLRRETTIRDGVE